MNHDDSRILLIDPTVQALLDARGIREENIQQVLSVAEGDNLFHSNKETGHRLAYLPVGKVTYWVEYGAEAGGFRIVTAYSHRMKIWEGYNLPSKKEETTDWSCAKCGDALAVAAVKLAYLDETFVADLPSCPTCQRVLVSEENAVVKMALAERMLEDK